MARAFAKRFYSSKAWQTCRNEYAKQAHYLCEECLKHGIYKPGEIVHHKIELDPVNIERPEIALSFNNLELLCRDCHAKMHEQSGGRWSEVNKRKREKKESESRYKVDEFGHVSTNELPLDAQKRQEL